MNMEDITKIPTLTHGVLVALKDVAFAVKEQSEKAYQAGYDSGYEDASVKQDEFHKNWQEIDCPACGFEGAKTFLKPADEPVAWGIANTRPTERNSLMMVMLDEPAPSHLVVPLYTRPQPAAWVGLTDEQIYLEIVDIDLGERGWAKKFARAIEAAHGIKENT